ncbi:MAG: radical SAM protein, partial [Candidatus Bathyarchaeota archaeon]|nr:radical SAM protein [Candidatus Bathyarchaeota archaeon]
MKFGGFQKTSLIDFPGRISSILFTVGCNLRCPFCYNGRLIIEPKPPFLSEEDALRVLESRKKYVDAVVITGGEPALNEDLSFFVRRLKEKGFSVKLDTNG